MHHLSCRHAAPCADSVDSVLFLQDRLQFCHSMICRYSAKDFDALVCHTNWYCCALGILLDWKLMVKAYDVMTMFHAQ